MVTLQPMSDNDFKDYIERLIPDYARDKVEAGNWSEEEALERSRTECEGLLPQGPGTPGNHLFNLTNDANQKIGVLWYAANKNTGHPAFIYDFEIFEPFRRRGYARQALAQLDEDAKKRGFKKLELHVFGHNMAARELYKTSGFTESNVIMTKSLD